MRWLNCRLRSDRGASAVLVGILLVPLIGFLAIAIDVGALYVERAQLQNGADAAALAIATDCSDGVCSNPAGLVDTYTDANANDGAANALAPAIDMGKKTVTVTDSTLTAGGQDALQHFFASLIGTDSTTVRARATAEWGGPGSGPVLALALSWCEFQDSLGASGKHVTIRTDTNKTCKRSPSTEIIPGGFGWLDNTTSPCEATINLSLHLNSAGELWVQSDPGGDAPSSCKPRLSSLKDKPLLIPIYDLVRGTGTNAEYRIFAFAGFTITGWKFPSTTVTDPLAPPCTGNCRGIQGYFTEWVSIDSAFGLGGPQLNAPIVRLIK